jgi:ATP-dependent helicase/nuclease subunit A
MLRNFLCKDNRDDDELRKCVISLYRTAMKQPYPERWLKKVIAGTNVKSEEKLEKQEWMKKLLEYQRNMNASVLDEIESVKGIYENQPGSEYFDDIVQADMERIHDINTQGRYSLMRDAAGSRWKTFSAKKKILAAGCPETVVEEFTARRDGYKKLFKDGFMLTSTVDEILAAYVGYRKYYVPLAELTLEFMREYDALKKKRKLFEFHDISHMAYNLLCRRNFKGGVIPTELAVRYSENYSCIFIDEYQDGDYIQEGILTSISCNHNMCMVGDVKQSIYGFRNARPEIFLDKYDRYTECSDLSLVREDEKELKILLNQNFRSRKNVLDATNFFFWQLMDKSLGGLDYGEDTMLVEGCPHPESPSQLKTEILVAKSYDSDENVSKHSKEELETAMIVNKITEILNGENPMMVLKEDYQDILKANPDMSENEKKTELYRRAVPGDICILLRSVKKAGEQLSNALTSAGIPVNIDNSEGYYEAVELRIVISLLEVTDNRYQDIPLEAVLVSPVAGLDENEMALVVKYGRDEYVKGVNHGEADKTVAGITLYEKCDMFLALFERDEQGALLSEKGRAVYKRASLRLKAMLDDAYIKLYSFFDFLDRAKKLSREITVSELIWRLLDESGYYEYAAAMPDGARRCANLDKLMDMAKGFENGSYKGLFRFIQYMKQIEIENIDVGEVSAGRTENAVKIMTMHKSKGLEYPVVFVSMLCKQLGGSSRDILTFDNDYYISGRYIDDVNRYRLDNAYDDGISALIKAGKCAEEMRLLYVAMTRAKEKLYLTGCETADYNKRIEKKCTALNLNSLRLPYSIRCSESGYMFWIECCYARLEMLEGGEAFSDGVTDETGKNMLKNASKFISRKEYEYEYLESVMQRSALAKAVDFEKLIAEAKAYGSNSRLEEIKKEISYDYPYRAFTGLKNKYSISEIKRMRAYEVPEDDAAGTLDEISASQGTENSHRISASERGTLIHKFMELLDFAGLDEALDVPGYMPVLKAQLNEYTGEGIYNADEAKVIPLKKIALLLTEPLGQRMIRAAKRGELFREKAFTKAFPAAELSDIPEGAVTSASDDLVLVQGIIDAYFFEEGKAVLVDYKTDHKAPEQLAGLYHAQLEYYAKTIESLLDREVGERLIYSFHNDCVVTVN